jgi:hypothetical protein
MTGGAGAIGGNTEGNGGNRGVTGGSGGIPGTSSGTYGGLGTKTSVVTTGGSNFLTGNRGFSESLFPQRARTRFDPSVRTASPWCTAIRFFVQ